MANSDGTVHVGNAHGKIAIWCDESEAIEIAEFYGPRDAFYKEVMKAVSVAYPKTERERGNE